MVREIQGSAADAFDAHGEQQRDRLKAHFANSEFAQKLLAQLEDEGYVVLPGIFSTEEADAEYDRAWDFVEAVSPGVRRGDPQSWWPRSNGVDPWPQAQRDMMQLHQAGWVFTDLRERFAERVFAPMYGTRELHCSKDGFTFQRPTEGWPLHRTANDHFDQGPQFYGLHCVQGSVALTDQEEADGCFQCWPRSHRFHQHLLAGKPHGVDFIILKDAMKDVLLRNGIQPVRVPVKRGDVILWRSDLCHCGAPPLGERPGFRAVAYVCCLPAAFTPEAVYHQKLRAYRELQTGSHWPSREEWFRPKPGNRGLQIRPYFKASPLLTDWQRQLHGVTRYPPSTPASSPAETRDEPVLHAGDDAAGSADRQEAMQGAAQGPSAPTRRTRWRPKSGVDPQQAT